MKLKDKFKKSISENIKINKTTITNKIPHFGFTPNAIPIVMSEK